MVVVVVGPSPNPGGHATTRSLEGFWEGSFFSEEFLEGTL